MTDVHVFDEAEHVTRAAETLCDLEDLLAVVDAALDDGVHLHGQACLRCGIA